MSHCYLGIIIVNHIVVHHNILDELFSAEDRAKARVRGELCMQDKKPRKPLLSKNIAIHIELHHFRSPIHCSVLGLGLDY